jgi:hypothetical protein
VTQAQARTLFRLWTNETNTTVLSNANIDLFCQSGQEALNLDTYYHRTDSTSDITLVAGTQEYALPADCIDIIFLKHNGVTLKKTSMSEMQKAGLDWTTISNGVPEKYYLNGNKIGFVPAPNAAAVAAAANPVFRYVSTPTEFSSTAFNLLPSQFHRLVLYFAVAEWWGCPMNGVRSDLVPVWMQKYTSQLPRAKAYYDRLGVEAGLNATR